LAALNSKVIKFLHLDGKEGSRKDEEREKE